MYGHIHFVVKDLVTSKFGQAAWEAILIEAGMSERDHFMLFYHYKDEITIGLIGAASKCLVHSPARPICESNDDGSLLLHYYSARFGLYPLVKGVIKAVAREIFSQQVQVEFVSQNVEELEGQGKKQEHVVLHVTIIDEVEAGDEKIKQNGHKEILAVERHRNQTLLPPVTLTKTEFVRAFPYHLIFDSELRLLQFGESVAKLSPVPLYEGMYMTSAFHIRYPRMSFTVANIQRFINTIYVIALHGGDDSDKDFSMKGQMIWMSESERMIFIGSPRLTSLKEMKKMNVFMADIPLYDVTREMVLLYQQRNAEIDITKKLDETTAELKRTAQALKLEQLKTEQLLYRMLPQKVAHQLKNGQQVEAEKFDQVTILFSDIVTFTNISSACTPMDVVNMLNDLYNRFDAQTNIHGVYKVETIGDAYMVVSGVPEPTDVHAQPVANFALDMIHQAACVKSPATGKPLQIRVGIHTGPVVAGVVGVKMPRYCLFGDTVNTASRMESHGVPGRIHLSPTTFSALQGHGYVTKHRGETNIKGKGIMKTYFLIGNSKHVISEPEDEFIQLPFIDSDVASNVDDGGLPRDNNAGKKDATAFLPSEIRFVTNNDSTHQTNGDDPGSIVKSSTFTEEKTREVSNHETKTPMTTPRRQLFLEHDSRKSESSFGSLSTNEKSLSPKSPSISPLNLNPFLPPGSKPPLVRSKVLTSPESARISRTIAQSCSPGVVSLTYADGLSANNTFEQLSLMSPSPVSDTSTSPESSPQSILNLNELDQPKHREERYVLLQSENRPVDTGECAALKQKVVDQKLALNAPNFLTNCSSPNRETQQRGSRHSRLCVIS